MKARDKTEEGDEARVCGEVCLPVVFELNANGRRSKFSLVWW